MLPVRAAIALFVVSVLHAAVPFDGWGVRPGPVTVTSTTDVVTVHWNDEANRPWSAEFSLDPKAPLIRSIQVNGAAVVENARPFYQCTTGKRRGGWDEFFDFPPSHPGGTHSFSGELRLEAASAVSVGDPMEIAFCGLPLGPFTCTLPSV